MVTAAGAGVLLLFAVRWLWNELEVVRDDSVRMYIQAGTALVMLFGFGGLLWWLLNKPQVVEFMIATESEMRKVNWPTRRELIGSTCVVIAGTVFLAFMLFFVDIAFVQLFKSIGVLEGGG